MSGTDQDVDVARRIGQFHQLDQAATKAAESVERLERALARLASTIATYWAAVVGLVDVGDAATNAVFTLAPSGQPSYVTLGLHEVGASLARTGWGDGGDEGDE